MLSVNHTGIAVSIELMNFCQRNDTKKYILLCANFCLNLISYSFVDNLGRL